MKLILIILITLMVTSCKNNNQQNANGTSEQNTQVEDNKIKDLRIHYHSNNKYTLNDKNGVLLPVFKLAAEKTNVNIISTANPVAQKSEEELILQAANKFPDDIYGGNNSKKHIYAYAEEGAFIPLQDLVDEHAPNIKKFFEERPDVKKALTTAEGDIYMIPYVPDGGVARTYFIRTDWLKKLNLEVPKTVEDLEKVLIAFREQDPNGNGQKDEIPLFNDKWEEIVRTATLFGARVYGNDSFSERVVLDDNDNLYHAWTHEDFKNAFIEVARWYKLGLIDPEFVTRKQNTARQTLLAKEDRGGVTHEWLASTASYNYNEEILKANPDFKLEAFLPPSYKGVDGFEEHRRTQVKPDGWGISHSAKDPVAAIKFMDWFFSEEGKIASNFGIEGDSYTLVDGKPVFTEKVLKSGTVNQFLYENYGTQYMIGYAQNYEYEKQWTVKEGQDAYKLYEDADPYTKPYTPILNFNKEETATYAKYASALHTYQDEMIQGFITGKFDITKEWDSYVVKCKELGSEEIVGIYKSAYERYKSSN